MYVQARYRKPKKFNYDRSGLVIMATGPKLRNFIVGQVIKGSPASKSGILDNDEIIKINKRKVKFMSLSDLLRKFQKRPGKRIRLEIKRGDQIFTKEFLLKDLI